MNLPTEFVQPDYLGRTIANIPATAAAMLNIPFNGLPPLQTQLWQPLGNDVKRVVVLLVDGFGWNLLEKERPFLAPFLARATVVDKITSIFPSTTVAAMNSLWTGVGPAQHGMMGLQLLFPEMGTMGQMIHFTPTFAFLPDALVTGGLEPETFIQWPSVAQQFARANVPTYAFKNQEYLDSALSIMFGRGVAEDYGVRTLADMLTQMRLGLEKHVGESLYQLAYWPALDILEHDVGWDGESAAAEMRAVITLVQMELLDRLSAAARQNTVFILTADHGQVVCPPTKAIYLEDHPVLADMLFLQMAGEARMAYLYAKHGRIEDVIAYINTHLSYAMIAGHSDEALAAGWFGPQPHTRDTAVRAGDVVVALRENYIFVTSHEKDDELVQKLLGRHGSMTADEMIVPWIAMRLDD